MADAQQNEFAGVPVVVAGGHLGVGPAVVRAFAAQGAKVVVGELAHQPPSEAQRQACALPGVQVLPLDLSGAAPIASFFDACEKANGGLSIVVMVPPPVKVRAALDIPEADWRAVVEQELTGPLLAIVEAGRRLAARGGGRIISFTSMSGKTGMHRNVAPYAAAKGGVIAFSRAFASDLAHTGVTVNVIATALFDVQVAAGSEHMAEVLKGIPVGRVGRSEEAAHAVLFLASRNAGYVTGETMNLSGGRFMD